MNARGHLYFAYLTLRGSAMPAWYRRFLRTDRNIAPGTVSALLGDLLCHCRDEVKFYRDILRGLGDPREQPLAVLSRMPILTKAIIRERFEDLKSHDLARRRWRINTSGGSTGEPARFVQDEEYEARTNALAAAFSHWAGYDIGDPEVRLWGSEREVLQGTEGWSKRAALALTGATFLNAFRMTPTAMREFAQVLRRVRPRLVLAYAQALYELAGFLEANGIAVSPPGAIITSAGTLDDFMRQRIARVFRCPVYNRYGSREVGLIAAERPGVEGLWIPPWNTFVEVVDEEGRPVPDGTAGEILVTSLANRAMPLVRYRIGDRGALAPGVVHGSRALSRVLGRNVDAFRRRDGTLVDGEYFTHLLYFRDWVAKFQFVQKDYEEVLLRVVSRIQDRSRLKAEVAEIAAQVRAALDPGTVLKIEWVDDIPLASSGKYRYTISELAPP